MPIKYGYSIYFILILNYFNLFGWQCIEYQYPVAGIDEESIFVIHQKGLSDLELWRYFWQDNRYEKCLDWHFIPSGLKILPNREGFSFIDSGRLRIKKFLKRSPCSIEFEQPISSFGEINWVNQYECYFSARQSDYTAIFYGNVQNGEIKCLHQAKKAACLSPRMVSNQLFYIERNDLDRSCKIYTVDLNGSFQKPELMIDCNYQQVLHLQMISKECGFYVEHMPYINEELEEIHFNVYKLELSDKWLNTRLFQFVIPGQYLLGENRLYESIIPFLPRVEKTALYFADIKRNQAKEYDSSLKKCDLISGKIFDISLQDSGNLLFAPLIWQEKIFYGKILYH